MNKNSFNKTRLLKRIISQIILIPFIIAMVLPAPLVYSQSVANLPTPGTFVSLSPSYTPAIVAGITVYPDNPLQFDFIIDVGDDNLQGEELREESEKLISYFMATLTVPEDEMWVNLSPYEKDRIIADGLGDTILGRDMLAQDYILKQLTASMMYPEDELGGEFWQRIYKKAEEKFGTTEIPTNTFNKIWIIPEEAVIYANGTNIFIAESRLKVMMEEDYLALEHHDKGLDAYADNTSMTEEAKKILKEVLLPEIEKEVNEGKNFAPLRQIYHSMILATWYKNNLKESLLGRIYVDQNKVDGLDVDDKEIKNKIYNQYVQAFKKGVYDYIREDYDQTTQEIIPRKYFSGGEDFAQLSDQAMSATDNVPADAWLQRRSAQTKVRVTAQAQLEQSSSPVSTDNAMLNDLDQAKSDVQGVLTIFGLEAYQREFDSLQDSFTLNSLQDFISNTVLRINTLISRGEESTSDEDVSAIRALVDIAFSIEARIVENIPENIDQVEVDRPGHVHIIRDKHSQTINHVDALVERMRDADIIFLEVPQKWWGVDFERIFNEIARGEKTSEQAIKENFLLGVLLEAVTAPGWYPTHVKAVMEALQKTYETTGRKRTVINEFYKKKWWSWSTIISQFRDYTSAKNAVRFFYSGNKERTLKSLKKFLDMKSSDVIERDRLYGERIRNKFSDESVESALLVRGAAHTGLVSELRKTSPEIELSMEFPDGTSAISSLGALLQKLVFLKTNLPEIDPDVIINDLEYFQALLEDETGLRSVESMDGVNKLFDDVKGEEISKLKKKERQSAFLRFYARWLSDNAMLVSSPLDTQIGIQLEENIDANIVKEDDVVGGIDFDAGNLNLKEQGDTMNIKFTNLPLIEANTVNGVTPIIINITPIANFPFLIGKLSEGNHQLSQL